MLVSHRYKFIYLKNRKVAGSSVESVFQKYCLPEGLEGSYSKFEDVVPSHFSNSGIIAGRLSGYDAAIGWKPHSKADDVLKFLGEDLFYSYFKFSVIRNPFDKMVSKFWWRSEDCSLVEKQNDLKYIRDKFSKFVFNGGKSMDWKVHTINNNPICDFYIKYEDLNNGVAKCFEKIGLKDNYVVPKFKSKTRLSKFKYQDYYTEDTKEVVEKIYKNEIDFFKYQF